MRVHEFTSWNLIFPFLGEHGNAIKRSARSYQVVFIEPKIYTGLPAPTHICVYVRMRARVSRMRDESRFSEIEVRRQCIRISCNVSIECIHVAYPKYVYTDLHQMLRRIDIYWHICRCIRARKILKLSHTIAILTRLIHIGLWIYLSINKKINRVIICNKE
jgi:hypothetical protein